MSDTTIRQTPTLLSVTFKNLWVHGKTNMLLLVGKRETTSVEVARQGGFFCLFQIDKKYVKKYANTRIQDSLIY